MGKRPCQHLTTHTHQKVDRGRITLAIKERKISVPHQFMQAAAVTAAILLVLSYFDSRPESESESEETLEKALDDSGAIQLNHAVSSTNKTTIEIPLSLNSSPKYLSINGHMKGSGTARVYLKVQEKTYKVLDSEETFQKTAPAPAAAPEPAHITTKTAEEEAKKKERWKEYLKFLGYIVAIDNTDQNTSQTSEEAKRIVPLLTYEPNTPFDADNDGIETENGIIDFTVGTSHFTWQPPEEQLCTQWAVKSLETQQETLLCNGGVLCCLLVELAPTESAWNAPFYLPYRAHGTTRQNTVGARIIYASYALDTTADIEVVNSSWSYLNATYLEEVSFEGQCQETCALPALEAGENATLIIEIENATINITNISYLPSPARNLPPRAQTPPPFTLKRGGTMSIDLDTYFNDPNGDALTYAAASNTPKVSIKLLDGKLAIITVHKQFAGTATLVFTADDGTQIVQVQTTLTLTEDNNTTPYLQQLIPHILLQENQQATVNLSQYFTDAENTPMTYTATIRGDATITIDRHLANISMDSATDRSFAFITANDGELTTNSNIFSISRAQNTSNASNASNASQDSADNGTRTISNLTQIQTIPTLRIPKGTSYSLAISGYFTGAKTVNYTGRAANISISANDTHILITPDLGFKGARSATIIATPKEGNVTLESNTFTIMVSAGAVNVDTARSAIVLGQPVKWQQNITLEQPENITVELPKEAANISIVKIEEGKEKAAKATLAGPNRTIEAAAPLTASAMERITGNSVLTITGRATTTQEISEEEAAAPIEFLIEDNATQYVIEYVTEAPTATEENTTLGKKVIISGPDALNYTDVLTFTTLPELYSVGQEKKIKLYWVENKTYLPFDAYDLDDNTWLDYMEWTTPHLSNQTFNIILISRAEHLDENRTVIEDVYETVRAKDNQWSPLIEEGHYVRVTFERNLTANKDITIVARSNESATIEVYEKDQDDLLVAFSPLTEQAQQQRVQLTGLLAPQDTFDLRITGGGAEFDYVVDPSIDSCGDLDSPDTTYTLTQDLYNESTCFTVKANNVVLDCAGYTINYANYTRGTGINITGYNGTIVKNCILSQATNIDGVTNPNSPAIFVLNANSTFLFNLTANTTGNHSHGIQVHQSNFTNITRLNANITGNLSDVMWMHAGYGTNLTNSQLFRSSPTGTDRQGISINVNNSANILLEQNTFLDQGQTTTAFELRNSTQVTFKNTTVNTTGVAARVINVRDSSHVFIEDVTLNSTVTNTQSSLIMIDSSSFYLNISRNRMNLSGGAIQYGIQIPTTFTGGHINITDNLITVISSNTGSATVIVSDGQNITLHNNTATIGNLGTVVSISSANHTKITDNRLTTQRSNNGGNGITLNSAAHTTIRRNNVTFTAATSDGVSLTNSPYNIIDQNNISYLTGTGDSADLITITGTPSKGNNITNNYLRKGAGAGRVQGIILSSGANQTLVSSNDFQGEEIALQLQTASHSLVSENRFITTSTFAVSKGISIEQRSWHNVFINNNITSTGGSGNGGGIRLIESGANDPLYNNITDNFINTTGTTGYGIALQADASSNLIQNNIINTTAATAHGIYLTSTRSNSILNNNITTKASSTFGLLIEASNNTLITGNLIFTTADLGYGLQLQRATRDAFNNTIYNNVFNTTAAAVNITTTGMTNFFNTSRIRSITILGGPYLGGNIYYNSTEGGQPAHSQSCLDDDHDDICNSVLTHDADNIDYLPLQAPPYPPVPSNNRTNTTNFFKGASINFSINWSDESSLSFAILADNQSGTYANGTHIELSGKDANISQSLTVTASKGQTFGVQWFANDSSGNTHTTPPAFYTVGNALPTIPTILRPNGVESSNNFSAHYSAFEPDGESVTYYLYLNGQFNKTSEGNTTLYLADGYNNLNISAYDGEGWSQNATISFQIDTHVPYTDFFDNTPANDTATNQNWILVNVTIVEANISNITYQLHNLSSLVNRTTVYDTQSRSFNFTNLPMNTIYSYNVTVTANNTLTNTTQTRSIRLDNELPNTNLTRPRNNSQQPSTVTFNWTTTDVLSVPLTCSLLVNETVNTTITGIANQTATNFTLVMDRGDYNWSVNCTDRAGNQNRSQTFFFIIDFTPPQTTITTPQNNTYDNDGNITIQFSATDATGIESCSLYHNATGTYHQNQTNSSMENGQNTQFSLANIPDETTFVWSIDCTDLVEPTPNRGSTENFTLTVDRTVPTAFSLQSPGNHTITTNTTPTFSWQSTTDTNFANYTLQISNTTHFTSINTTRQLIGTAANTTLIFNETLANDTYWYWRVIATDKANNTRTSTAGFLYVTDATPPLPNLSATPNPTERAIQNTTITWTAADLHLNQTHTNISYLNGTLIRHLQVNTTFNTTGLETGNYTLILAATDTAGNLNITELNITVQDTTLPGSFSLHLPADGTISSNLSPTLNWTVPYESKIANYSVEVTNSSAFSYINYTFNTTEPNYPLTIDLTPEMTWYWRVISYDSEGQRRTSLQAFSYKPDNQSPRINDETRTPSVVFANTTVEVNATITDPNLETITLEGNWSPTGLANITATNKTGNIYRYSINQNLTARKTVQWRYYANDSAGNTAQGTLQTFQVQNTPPSTPALTGGPANNSEHIYNTIPFSWQASSDIDQDSLTYELRVDDSQDLSSPEANITGISSTTYTLQQGLPKGLWYWSIRSFDGDNRSAFATVRTITTVPAIINITTQNNTEIQPGQNISINVTELNETDWIQNMYITIRSTNYTATNISSTQWQYNYTVENISAQNLPITAYAYNQSTNTTAQHTILLQVVNLNPNPPTIVSLCSNETYALNNSNVTLQAVSSLDTFLKAINVSVQLPNGSYTQPAHLVNTSSGLRYTHNYTLHIDQTGNHILKVNVTDIANQSAQGNSTIYAVNETKTITLTQTQGVTITLQDPCLGSQGRNGTQFIVPVNAKYNLKVETSAPVVTFKDINLTGNISTLANYSDLGKNLSAPSSKRSLIQFELNTTLSDYGVAIITYNYSTIESTIQDEENIVVYRCANTSSCTYEALNTTVNMSSNIITANTTNFSAFVITEPLTVQQITNTVTTTSTTSGGGGSTVVVTEEKERNVTQYVSLNILVPQAVSMYSEDSITVPVTLHNRGNVTLQSITLSAQSNNSNDVVPSLTTSYVQQLDIGQQNSLELILDSHTLPSHYEVTINATVQNPAYDESVKIFIDLLDRYIANKTLIIEKIRFAQDLFKENPECLELQSLLQRAEQALNQSQYQESFKLTEQAINGCKDLITNLRQQRIVNTAKKVGTGLSIGGIAVAGALLFLEAGSHFIEHTGHFALRILHLGPGHGKKGKKKEHKKKSVHKAGRRR